MQYRKIKECDFDFINKQLSEKYLSFDEVNLNASFVGVTENEEIVSYVLLSNNNENRPEILKHTDAFVYRVVDIYTNDGYDDDLSRTSYYLIKSLKQYAFIWCYYNVNIPSKNLKAAFFNEANDLDNNDHFYFINTLDIGTLNEN